MVKTLLFFSKRHYNESKNSFSVKLDFEKMTVILFVVESCAPGEKKKKNILGLKAFYFKKIYFR